MERRLPALVSILKLISLPPHTLSEEARVTAAFANVRWTCVSGAVYTLWRHKNGEAHLVGTCMCFLPCTLNGFTAVTKSHNVPGSPNRVGLRHLSSTTKIHFPYMSWILPHWGVHQCSLPHHPNNVGTKQTFSSLLKPAISIEVVVNHLCNSKKHQYLHSTRFLPTML